VEERIKKRWHIYIMGYYLAWKNKKILTFEKLWMKLEDITLTEIKPGTEKQIPHDVTYV
jgi:hypothetical protein